MKRFLRQLGCLLFGLYFLFVGALALPAGAASASADVAEVANGIILWKKADVGSGADGYLINDTFLRQAGTTPGDWFPIGLGRLGVADGQAGYLAVINDRVQKRYQTPEKLSRAKSTEWHRIALAVLACGGNPRRMGENGDIDLIADGTYGRVDENGNGILGRQGINGFIWGLITLDSLYYEVPEGACYTRDDIILNILNRQLTDGGWALSGGIADPDITAMAIQALAPYCNSEKEYTYPGANGVPVTKKVRTAIDEALKCLSDLQQQDGGFVSWGMPNCESAVQVAAALCSLGIDPFTDVRFLKNGRTVYDGILKYRNGDGGFLHSFVYDPENPTSLPDRSNTMASEQALYGMAAILRLQNGMRRLYDFRPEQGDALRQQIAGVQIKIDTLTWTSETAEIAAVYEQYLAIDAAERSYVRNYRHLSELLAFAGIPYAEEKVEYNSGDAGVIRPMEEFTDTDRAATDALPGKLTTAYRVQVLKLWEKIRNCFDFEGKSLYEQKLKAAKEQIEAIQAEIDRINADIREKLYPFDGVSLKDKKTVDEIVARYRALDEYDRAQIDRYEDVIKTKTKLDNLLRGLMIGAACLVVAVVVAVFLVRNIHRRRHQRERELEELAAEYRDEP